MYPLSIKRPLGYFSAILQLQYQYKRNTSSVSMDKKTIPGMGDTGAALHAIQHLAVSIKNG